MKPVLIILLAAAAAAFAAGPAAAAPCGLPDAKPLWVDYGTPELLERFGRPGVVVAGSGGGDSYPAKARSLGAKTVYWDMYLKTRVGTPSAPAQQDLLPARAQRVFDFAVLSAGCPDPVIAMNELFGASTPTPWTQTTAGYRANVLEWARLLKAKGGHPVLLVSSEPYTGGEAGQWWRELAQVSDIALEKYFNAPAVHRAGPELGSRRMRTSMRDSFAKLFAVGVPPAKLGVVLAFQTKRGSGGREGLEPAGAWFEVAKLQALAARQVARELGLAHIWSWGWGFFNEEAKDPDKLGAACVWLWARDPSLCAAEALPERFDRDVRAGQIDLPAGVRCALGAAAIRTNEIAALARVTGDAELALTALYARLVQQRASSSTALAVRAAEQAIVLRRFGGSRTPYLAALTRGRASSAIALGGIADELRREAIQARLRAPAPSVVEIAEFAVTYAGTQLRDIPGAGAVSGVAPETPLGLLPKELARPPIVRALRHAARAGSYDSWLEQRQHAALGELRCTRDRLPSVGTVRVTSWLPFLVPV
ncbi:MAG: hypothetical protein H0T10_03175, partial [Actinobacteria bacterium]|nr:hypothetical protein [Actinomycetota bacterium]